MERELDRAHPIPDLGSECDYCDPHDLLPPVEKVPPIIEKGFMEELLARQRYENKGQQII